MRFLKPIVDFLFPWPMTKSGSESEPVLSSTIDLLERDPALSLEVAYRIHDAEVRRRGTADTKAALYLAFLAAILPLIGALKPNVIALQQGWLDWIDTVLFASALIYLVAAAVLVMRAIATSMIHTLGERDLHEALLEGRPAAWIAQQTLLATMHNYHANNHKITFVNFAQRHVFRAMLMLTALVAWSWCVSLLPSVEIEIAQETGGTFITTICNEMDVWALGSFEVGDTCPALAIGSE